MSFENLRELSSIIKKFEVQAWDQERKSSASMSFCYAIVFFTYALLFIPIVSQEQVERFYIVHDVVGMVLIGIVSLLYGFKMSRRYNMQRLSKVCWWALGYHSFLLFSIFYLWATGTNVSITPLFIIVICLGFTWLHMVQYLVYITVLLITILILISLLEFNFLWFMEFVLLYLFAVTIHIFHVSQQCKLFNYQQVIEEERNLDSLTGLLNRRALEENYILHSQGSPNAAVILVDLDYFKNVNDTFGHAAGDQALTYAADIFKRVFRKGDLVARIGGDEFLIMLQLDQDAFSVLKRKIDLLMHQVPLSFVGNKGNVSMTFSVGAYLCAKDQNLNMEELIAKADSAMYRVKQDGRNGAIITSDTEEEVHLKGLEFPVKVIRL